MTQRLRDEPLLSRSGSEAHGSAISRCRRRPFACGLLSNTRGTPQLVELISHLNKLEFRLKLSEYVALPAMSRHRASTAPERRIAGRLRFWPQEPKRRASIVLQTSSHGRRARDRSRYTGIRARSAGVNSRRLDFARARAVFRPLVIERIRFDFRSSTCSSCASGNAVTCECPPGRFCAWKFSPGSGAQ